MTQILGWLQKATLTTTGMGAGTGDFDAAHGGLLVPEQAQKFLRMALDYSIVLKETDIFDSANPKFEVPRIDFAGRILRSGVEGTRLIDADRTTPGTSMVTLSTALFKGEVPVSDEVFEDNVEREGFADTLMERIAGAVGRDLEEIALKSDTANTSSNVLTQLPDGGILKQLAANSPAAQQIAAAGITTYDSLFDQMLDAIPARWRQDYTRLRFFVPIKHQDGYQKSLSARGTGLGDQAVSTDLRTSLAYRGIKVVGVPLLSGTETGSAITDYSTAAFLIDPQNIKTGYHRRVRMEKWRDPREGATSFVPTVRFDCKVAVPEAAVIATGLVAMT